MCRAAFPEVYAGTFKENPCGPNGQNGGSQNNEPPCPRPKKCQADAGGSDPE
jgi:hypothetical protein